MSHAHAAAEHPHETGATEVTDAPRHGDPLAHQIADEPATQPILPSRPGVNDASAPTDEAIARRAYELYVARGGMHGYDADDWLQAERELRETAERQPAPDRRSLETPID